MRGCARRCWGQPGWWQDVCALLFPIRRLRWGWCLKKKKTTHSLKTPTIQTRHNPPTQQTALLHCGFYVEVLVVEGCCTCTLSGSTDSHDELCSKVCVFVCVRGYAALDWNCSLSREGAWQSGRAAAAEGSSSQRWWGLREWGCKQWSQTSEWVTCVGQQRYFNVGHEEVGKGTPDCEWE